MKTALRYLRPFARRVCCGAAIKFTAAFLELVLPLLLAHIIDVCVPAGDLEAIWRTGGLMMVMACGAALCNVTANRMAAWVSMEVTRDLRGDLYSRVERLSCAQMDRFSISSLVSRLTNDTYHVHQMFDKVQRGGIRAPMLVLGGLVLTFFRAPALGLVQLVVCSLTFFTIWLVTRRGIPYYVKAQTAVDTVVRIIRENTSGVRVIKALACQERERARFQEANGDARLTEEAAGCVMAAANPITDFLLNSGLVLVVLAGAMLVNAGRMDVGQIVAFLSYFTLIQNATLGMAKIFVKISKGVASLRRIEEILQAPDDQLVRPSEERSEAELGMDDVSFSYLGVEKNLDSASFSLQKGEMLGILGPIGSGKTTLVSLLLLNPPSPKTWAAMLSTLAGVALAGGVFYLFSTLLHLSGMNDTNGEGLVLVAGQTGLELHWLLLVAVLISSLGAVMDVALSLASSLHELREADGKMSGLQLFAAGMRIGRDMIGTMSNTLILAFAGEAVTTLLLLMAYGWHSSQLFASDYAAIQVAQGVASTLGVVLGVPITSGICAALYRPLKR